MGRELRMIKKGWEHPRDLDPFYDDGTPRYRPLLKRSFNQAWAEWEEGRLKWAEGLREDWAPERHNSPNKLWIPIEEKYRHYTWEGWHGQEPREQDRMPEWAPGEATMCVMYENTSEGTPISPAFDNIHDLARWLADNGASAFGDMTADYEWWLAVCREGWQVLEPAQD